MRQLRAVLVVLMVAVFTCATPPSVASPGDLDPALGSDGKVLLGAQTSGTRGAAFMLVQPDGRIITVDGFDRDSGVWRVTADGALDASFGNGAGLAVIPTLPPNLYGLCRGLALQIDGKILVGLGNGSSFARLLPDGSLDLAFGTAGVASLSSPLPFYASGVAISAEGRIVAGGSSRDSSGFQQFALARFQANGLPDASFGAGGLLFTQISLPVGGASAFIQQPDGKLLIGGGDLIARFQPDGELDSSFGFGGVIRNDSPVPLNVQSIAVQPDTRILIAGNTPILGMERLAVVRTDSAGNRDPSFGTNGEVVLQVDPDTPSTASAVALDSRQRIVVAGASGDLNQFSNGFRRAVVARLNTDGSPDVFFSAHGITTFWNGYSSYGYAVAILPGDRIVVGSASEGAPDLRFGGFLRTPTATLFGIRGGDGAIPFYVSEGLAIEYYYPAFGHYFITATPNEIAVLDTFSHAWVRTGQSFKVWTENAAGLSPVCRFFSGQTFAPQSSHFYTPYPEECSILKAGTAWQFEGNAFDLQLPQGPLGQGSCPAGTAPLYRLYNNGQGGAPNHRYTDSLAIFNQMLAQGWLFEGEAQTKVFACEPAP